MSTRVYLGRLSRDVSDRDIEDLFRGFGRIREITLKNGFGFVEFSTPRDAEDAVYETNGKRYMGDRILVEIARGERRRDDDRFRAPERTEHRVILDNLPIGTSWQDIKDVMRKAGEVTFADINRDRDGQGVVEFATASDMQNALRTMDRVDMRGNTVTVREFDSARDTLRGGGADRGRDYERWDRDYERRDRRDRDRGGRDHDRDRDRGDRDRGDRDRGDRDRSDRDRDNRRRDRSRSRSRSPRGRRDDNNRDRSRDRDGGRASDRDRDTRERRASRSPAPATRNNRGRSRSPRRTRSPSRD
ncbi:hypothetical protein CPC16_008903 [Podila verticillata]|nr:hypothetical protein BGZ59_002737 [Podila verticillata]KAF9383477.1 hypothetical protein CPC16_008903 [Podila verticillata]KAI9240394.1 MAG: hypothetical protein BYD32DRAFT_408673 [Podila humilis]